VAAHSTTPSQRPRRLRRVLGNLLYALALLAVVIFLLSPFYWMVQNAFKTPLQIIKLPPELFFMPTLRNFENVFGTQNFMRYIMNSLIIGAGCTLVGLLLGLPAAYSIARFRQNRLAVAILMARMVPGITFLVPLFIVFRTLGARRHLYVADPGAHAGGPALHRLGDGALFREHPA
jgi:multiple sugar transport system permease protein